LEDLIAQFYWNRAPRPRDMKYRPPLYIRSWTRWRPTGRADKLTQWESEHVYTDASFRMLWNVRRRGLMRDKIINAVLPRQTRCMFSKFCSILRMRRKNVLQQLKGGADFNTLRRNMIPMHAAIWDGSPRAICLTRMWNRPPSSLQVGQISDVIQTNVGYDIIKVWNAIRSIFYPLTRILPCRNKPCETGSLSKGHRRISCWRPRFKSHCEHMRGK